MLPVASDFDALLIGSRGLSYPPLPAEHIEFQRSLLRNIASILKTPSAAPWAQRWREVLKADKGTRRVTVSGTFGGKERVDGKWGFGDEMSRAMVRHAASALGGAVRHAAESFNYCSHTAPRTHDWPRDADASGLASHHEPRDADAGCCGRAPRWTDWPQEMDDELLVVWDGFREAHSVLPWRHLGGAELRAFLLARVADGYAFPLNPKWVACDAGWYDVYEAMLRQPACAQALGAWMPPSSGLREALSELHAAHPEGFVRHAEEAEDAADATRRGSATGASAWPPWPFPRKFSLGLSRLGDATRRGSATNAPAWPWAATAEVRRYSNSSNTSISTATELTDRQGSLQA